MNKDIFSGYVKGVFSNDIQNECSIIMGNSQNQSIVVTVTYDATNPNVATPFTIDIEHFDDTMISPNLKYTALPNKLIPVNFDMGNAGKTDIDLLSIGSIININDNVVRFYDVDLMSNQDGISFLNVLDAAKTPFAQLESYLGNLRLENYPIVDIPDIADPMERMFGVLEQIPIDKQAIVKEEIAPVK